MRWFATLSNGEGVAERDEPGELSTWRLLMARCQGRALHLTGLCLVVNGIPSYCRPQAEGYWQAHLGFAVLGGATQMGAEGSPAPALHAKGVGWVEGGLLHTIWAAADGRIWREPPRPVAGQPQIIWAPGVNERLVTNESAGAAVGLSEPALLAGWTAAPIGEVR